MARGRMLNRKVAVDPEVAELVEREGVDAGLFYTWLIPFLDKWGNCRADKWWMKGNVVPRIEEISAEDCGRFVEAICELGLAQEYEVEGLPYLHFPGFLRNQKGLRTDREGTDVPTPPEWPSDEPFRAGHWERLRQVYRYTCLGCGKQKPTVLLSPDHVVPVRRGGPDTLENVQPLCESCNMKKADRIGDFRPPSTLDAVLDWVRSDATKEDRPAVFPDDWSPGTVSDPPGEVAVHPAYQPPEESDGDSGGLDAELVWSVSGVGVESIRKEGASNRARAEVEVEVEEEVEEPEQSLSAGARDQGQLSADLDTEDDDDPAPSGRSRAVKLPQSWEPNETHEEVAAEEGVDLEREEKQFRDHARANGRTQRDWDAAFRNWLRKAADFGSSTGRVEETKESASLSDEEYERLYGVSG